MKKLILIPALMLVCFVFGFSQSDSLNYANPTKYNIEKLQDEDFKKITTYEDQFLKTKKYVSKGRLGGERLWCKVVTLKDVATLSLDFSYKGSSWIFIDKVIVKIDNDIFEINTTNVNRNTYLGGVSEVANIIVEEEFFKALLNIDPKKTKVHIRYSGKRQYDFKVPRNQIVKLQRVFNFYKTLINSP